MRSTFPPIEDLAEVRLLVLSGDAKAIRERARVSQSDIARELGVWPATVSRWEAGDRVPTGRAAAAYLRVLRRLLELVEKAQ